MKLISIMIIAVFALVLAADVASAAKSMTITFAGTGTGSVLLTDTTDPSKTTTCTATCVISLGNSDVGTLTATANGGSTFTGWSGATWTGAPTQCTGTNSPCNFAMANSARSVTATFTGTSVYSLNTTYTFTETNSSSTWQSISIKDSSYADALANVSILNITSGRWESILTNPFTGGTSLAEHVNVIKGANGNASSYDSGGGQIKIRYNWTNSNFNNNLGIDMINVTVAYGTSSYSLNITTNTTSVYEDIDSNYYLEIRYFKDAGEPGYDVYVSNGSGWNPKGNLTSLGWTVANFTLSSSEIISGVVNVLYLDQTPAGAMQGNLYIDYQRVHNVTPAVSAGFHLDIIGNNTGIPEAPTNKLQVRYNVTGDNFTLKVYNGTVWNAKETLNKSSMTIIEVPLNADELLPDGNFGPFTVNDLPRYYVLVRYEDNRDAGPSGKLYLDYQRVYSS